MVDLKEEVGYEPDNGMVGRTGSRGQGVGGKGEDWE